MEDTLMSNQKHKLYLGIAGQLLSGKSSASNFLVQRFKAEHLRFSKLLDEMLDILDLEKNRFNEQQMGVLVKELFGEESLSNALKARAELSEKNVILFDGLRKKQEVDFLRQLPGFKFIYIKASPEIRYQRMRNRKEKVGESEQTYEEFLKSEAHEADKQIAQLEQLADFVISNESTPEQFEALLTRLLTTDL
ncbi:MAG: dephospho-CoA kinase [Candidatus Doudnabacteria bacterium]|nr:dephospho-CoA kinase [Candidatus Doudnabacteria bacterium]